MGRRDKTGANRAIFDRSFPSPPVPDESAAGGCFPASEKPLSVTAVFDGQQPSEAATAALLAHPRFVEAGRIVAAGLVALYQGERTVNLVMPDRVRYIISVFAVHLHFAGRPNDPDSGLTASRLCKLCVERKVCSAGRAESMLGIMREFGHLVPAPREEDMRLRRLVPAEPLFAWHRKRCMHFFAAAAKVLPDDADALASLDAPGFMPNFMRHLGRSHVAGFHYVEHVPDIRLFYERSAGGAILMRIMLSGAGRRRVPAVAPGLDLALRLGARLRGVARARAAAGAGRCERRTVEPGQCERGRARGCAASVGRGPARGGHLYAALHPLCAPRIRRHAPGERHVTHRRPCAGACADVGRVLVQQSPSFVRHQLQRDAADQLGAQCFGLRDALGGLLGGGVVRAEQHDAAHRQDGG